MSKVIVDEIQTDTTNGNVRVIPNGTGALEVKGDGSSNDAALQLNCYANSHGVKLKSPPHSAGQSYTMILPDNQIAADKYLKVKSITGSGATAVGQLEYADASGGITVQEEGSALSTAATTLNFVGSSVTASGTGATKTITISGGGGGVTSDAQFNTVAGTNAGNSFSGTSPEDNTLFGYNAGTAITTGDGNVCIGSSSGLKLTGGVHNVLIGVSAGQEGTTNSSHNVAIGNKALYNMTDGCNYNIAIGQEAGEAATTSQDNVFIGRRAAHAITSGYSNVAIGFESLYAATDDFQNVAIGNQALYQTEHNQNNGVGFQALYSNTTGYYNDAFGTYAGYAITTGHHNVCLGYQAGNSNSPSGAIGTGSNNVVLGNNNITNLYCADTSISSSDSRDKTDITSFNLGLAWVEALRPVTYRWDRRTWYGTDEQPYGTPDGSKKRSKLHVGFLAQEALEVEKANGYGTSNDDSLVVHLNEDETSYGMKYERLVPILVNAIKELSTRVKTLEGG